MMLPNRSILIITLSVLIIFISLYFYRNRTEFGKCDSGKMQSNVEILACLKNLKGDLLKEREVVFNDYLSLETPRVDPNFSILLADVKEKTTTWYKSTDGYRKAHCEARVANFADGSGYFEGVEMCEIELIRKDTNFLRERIKELENYSQDFTP